MDWRSVLVETLRAAGLEVEDDDDLRIERPLGGDAEAVRFDPASFLGSLPDETSAARRSLAAYASGIRHALLEPADSDADRWDFTDAAGRIGMALHAEPFESGTAAITGSLAWTHPLSGDLRFAVLIELDRGTRVLTRDQFDRWSATSDRVVSGARSMLFHQARRTSPQAHEEYDDVEILSVGDGYDAARSLILDDLFFGEFDDSSRLGMPTTNDLYFVRDGRDGAVEQLRNAVDDRVADADYPLAEDLFQLERGTPEPISTRGGEP